MDGADEHTSERTFTDDELPEDVWTIVIATFTAKHGLRAAKMLRKVARVSRLFALHAAAHPDNRLPPPGVNMPDVNWLTDSESESDDDDMTVSMTDSGSIELGNRADKERCDRHA